MKNKVAKLCAAAMVAGMFGAMPVNAASIQYGGAEFTNAQFELHFGGGDDRFERRGSHYFFNGHRGFRERRHGWRNFRGWWFPPAAFSFGLTIDPGYDRYPRRLNRRHIAWCYDHYRSYRDWDNSFQPYHGPRRQCRSPWG